MNLLGRSAYALVASVNIVGVSALAALIFSPRWFNAIFLLIPVLFVPLFIWAPFLQERVRLTGRKYPL